MKVDYIIVGLGLAGLAFAEELLEAKKTFLVFENNSQQSSLVAGGVYNPVILKRYTQVWDAKGQLAIALPFYKKLEKKLEIEVDEKFVTKKVFKSIEDQNNWFAALDKPNLKEYLDEELDTLSYDGIVSDFHLGNVKQTGRVDTKKLIKAYRSYLEQQQIIRFEKFEYDNIKFKQETIGYKNIEASKIVFCEGYGVKQNPFFKHLPLNEVKGETITIHAPDLNIKFLLKSTLFVMPLGNHYYKVGATFNWKDKTSLPTQEGREELITKLKKILLVSFKIVRQTGGVRPTVKDRRPLVGVHYKYSQLSVLNGLGTRGVMIAPKVAKNLFEHLERKTILDPQIDIKRFN